VRNAQQGKKLDSSEQKTEDKAEEDANDVLA
jgi:histidinol-phosphate aminotransferase